MSDGDKTHFGYREVEESDKARLVRGVFDSVAGRYDLMNDLMSAGAHRLWKRLAVELSGARTGHRILDLAGGTGDMAARFAPIVGQTGRIVIADINNAMLSRGRDRLHDAGICDIVDYVQADAEALPFAAGSFDCITIAFGLRNVTRKEKALRSMFEALRPGGRLLVLEFSQPTSEFIGKLYDAYSFGIIPRLGKLVTGDEDSYRYLAESIRMHPGQEQLRDMIEDAGYSRCDYHNLSGGIVAIHRGFRD